MKFAPTFKLMAALALPETTAAEFTVMVAVESATVGVTVMLVVVLVKEVA
jgi:hypothetical protein